MLGSSGTVAHSAPRARSSMSAQLGSFVDAGGLNSFGNFARSWQRAGTFRELFTTPRVNVTADENDEYDDRNEYEEAVDDSDGGDSILPTTKPQDIRARQHEMGAVDGELEGGASYVNSFPAASMTSQMQSRLQHQRRIHRQRHDSLADPVINESGNVLPRSSLPSRRGSDDSIGRPRNRTLLESRAHEETPLIDPIKETEAGPVIMGRSTLPQTTFNSINILVGMSMLALPYGLRLSGWVFGLGYFALAATVTCYTAKLLAKCMNVDKTGALTTFDDIGYVAFGYKGRLVVGLIFNLELLVVCIAFFILGADTFHVLVPELSVVQWKLIFGAVAIPLCMLPMHILSFTSIVGILSSVSIILLALIGGITKDGGEGSFREPAKTTLFPDNWLYLPKALGVLMASFGAHAVFPNIYKDMRHPQKFNRAINTAYTFAFSVESVIAISGYIMFGMAVKPELTEKIITTPGFAPWIPKLIFIAIAALPLTKIPLNARPVITTFLTILRLDPRSLALQPPTAPQRVLRTAVYILVPVFFASVSVLVPNFDLIVALMGSLECSLISIILPCLFHLSLFGDGLKRWEKLRDYGIIVFFSFPAVVGTVFAFLPDSLLGGVP